LTDHDREGVEDGEPADEQRDQREDHQRGGEDAKALIDGGGLFVRHGLAGDDLDSAGQDPGNGALHFSVVSARCGHYVDVVELADLADEALVGREGEGGQGGPVEVGGRVGDAGDGERSTGQVGQNHDMITDGEAILFGGVGVHHHVVARRGRRALRQVQGGDLGVRGVVDADRAAAAVGDRVALTGEELGVAGHLAISGFDSGQVLDR
jgi:hypothetical protein